MQQFANPARFLKLAEASCPPSGCRDGRVRGGLYLGARHSARRLPAGRDGADHVRACAGGVDGALWSIRSWRWPARRPLIFRHPLADIGGEGGGTDRRHVLLPGPRHRIAVGQADVGRLVGMGCAPHLDVRAVPALSRLHRGVAGDRGSASRRGHRAHRRHRRLHQRADRQILGRLVEFAAPAGQRVAHGRAAPSTPPCCGRCS